MSSGKWRPFCLGLNVLKATKCLTTSPTDVEAPNGAKSSAVTIWTTIPEVFLHLQISWKRFSDSIWLTWSGFVILELILLDWIALGRLII